MPKRDPYIEDLAKRLGKVLDRAIVKHGFVTKEHDVALAPETVRGIENGLEIVGQSVQPRIEHDEVIGA